MRRCLALIIAAAMLLSACAVKGNVGTENTAPAQSTEAVSEKETEAPSESTSEKEASEETVKETVKETEAAVTAETAASAEASDIWETVKEAYIFAFPLVLMDATMSNATNTEEVITGKAPVNQFMHGKALANAQFRNVVTPNVDTVYSQVWYDLSEEPMIYVLPETDRFCKVQLLDAWTNTPAVLDKPGAYAITLSDWEGELPEGVTRIDIPTSMAWSITRTVLSGPEDLPNVYEIQEGMQLLPLSAYVNGGEYQAPKGSYSEDRNYVPINKVLSMDPVTFFNTANELMLSNPPAEADAEMMEKIAAVNVGPGLAFDAAVLGGEAKEKWTGMLQNLRSELLPRIQKFSKKLGQWSYFDAPIAEYGTEYAYRALVAIAGLGANPVYVALYPKTETDADGNMLTGEKKYIIHFEEMPKVLDGGFWSITAYGDDDFLIDNPIDRYCVNDRSGLKANEDGSVDVILSKDAPEDTVNWLPVCEGGFHLFMRIYTPDMEALDTWTAPVVTVIE